MIRSILVLLILIPFSCTNVIEVNPNTRFNGTIFIEGLLIEGRTPVLYVSKSVPFGDEKVTPQEIFARGAEVYLNDGESTELLTPDSTLEKFRCRWIPFFKGTEPVEFGKIYSLEVRFEGETYTASTRVDQQKPTIKEIAYIGEFYDLYGGHDGVNIILEDPSGPGDHYRFQMNRRIDNTVMHAHVLDGIKSDCTAEGELFWVTDLGRTVFTDEGIDGSDLDLLVEVSYEYSEGDSTWITIQSLNETSAFFYQELDDQLISILNPFVEPVFIESELDGGAIGYFGSAVLSDSVLFIYPRDNP